ncbi:MAG: Gfo/Idh/MocA family oxidoreductase [Casimicrobiaceae bacterium]
MGRLLHARLPRVLAVRGFSASGAIGTVRIALSQQLLRPPAADALRNGAVPWRVNPALSGGGFFFEGACHTLDLLDFLFGPITVRAFAGDQAGRVPRRRHRDSTTSTLSERTTQDV